MDSASGMILDMELVHVSETDGKLFSWFLEKAFHAFFERKKKWGVVILELVFWCNA